MTHLTPVAGDQGVGAATTRGLCLAAVFLYSGAAKLLFWSGGIDEFTGLGLPMPVLALTATVVLQLGAGTALAIGWWSGPAALVLAAFTVAATLIGHPFWTFEGADFHRQLTTALEHLAIVGGLVAIAATGPRGFSFRRRYG